jgi:hypothetical protein
MPSDAEGRLPDWIVIGAMKCATTSLHRYLAEHPDIATSTPKELDFFIADRYDRLGIDWYAQQFLDPPGASVAGESSVNYTKRHEFPGVAERMHRHLPDVKLIYVLRDPIDRIESHWIHAVDEGSWRGDFSSAIRDLESSVMVQTSRYWSQLGEYLRYYDPAQIRVLSYEALSNDPGGVVRDVLEFVGLDPDFEHPLIGRRIHRSSRKMRPNRFGLLFWDDRVRRRKLRKYLRRVVASPIERPVWTPADRSRVEEYLRPEVQAIREFSNNDFAEWSI